MITIAFDTSFIITHQGKNGADSTDRQLIEDLARKGYIRLIVSTTVLTELGDSRRKQWLDWFEMFGGEVEDSVDSHPELDDRSRKKVRPFRYPNQDSAKGYRDARNWSSIRRNLTRSVTPLVLATCDMRDFGASEFRADGTAEIHADFETELAEIGLSRTDHVICVRDFCSMNIGVIKLNNLIKTDPRLQPIPLAIGMNRLLGSVVEIDKQIRSVMLKMRVGNSGQTFQAYTAPVTSKYRLKGQEIKGLVVESQLPIEPWFLHLRVTAYSRRDQEEIVNFVGVLHQPSVVHALNFSYPFVRKYEQFLLASCNLVIPIRVSGAVLLHDMHPHAILTQANWKPEKLIAVVERAFNLSIA